MGVGVGVSVGGTGVSVGGTGVSVGGTGVSVGGTGVSVGATGVSVGGTGVSGGVAVRMVGEGGGLITSKLIFFLISLLPSLLTMTVTVSRPGALGAV